MIFFRRKAGDEGRNRMEGRLAVLAASVSRARESIGGEDLGLRMWIQERRDCGGVKGGAGRDFRYDGLCGPRG